MSSYLEDVDGNKSSKRLITWTATIILLVLCIVGFIGFMFGLAVNEPILQILAMLVFGGQTTIVAERFGKSFSVSSTDDPSKAQFTEESH